VQVLLLVTARVGHALGAHGMLMTGYGNGVSIENGVGVGAQNDPWQKKQMETEF
jgi:hypothetical protein